MDEALCTKFLLAHLLNDVEVQCLDVKLQRDLSCKLHLLVLCFIWLSQGTNNSNC